MSDTITVTGNVATTPVHRILPSGVEVITFRLASTQRRLDRDRGAWVDAGTNWYSVSAYRRLAHNGIASLKVGDAVFVSGRLRVREWDNDAGRGTAVDLDADTLGHDLRWGTADFVRSKRGEGASDQTGSAQTEWSVPGLVGASDRQHPERVDDAREWDAAEPTPSIAAHDGGATASAETAVPF